MDNQLDFSTICEHVGRLFLLTHEQLNKQANTINQLSEELARRRLEAERKAANEPARA